MLAVAAAVLFLIAVILFVVGHGYVLWMLIGLACLAAHLAYPYTPYTRRNL